MKTEKIEDCIGRSALAGPRGKKFAEEAYAELAELKFMVKDFECLFQRPCRERVEETLAENERLREVVGNGIMALRSIPQDALGRDPMAGHFYRDELIARMKVALGQELVIKEDKTAQCRKRAIELVYGGKCDHMTGAEVRQMLVDEFGEETVTSLAMGFSCGKE